MLIGQDSTRPIKYVLLRRSTHRICSVSHSNLINAGRQVDPPPPPPQTKTLRIYTIHVDDLL